jgi:hypothetical protein
MGARQKPPAGYRWVAVPLEQSVEIGPGVSIGLSGETCLTVHKGGTLAHVYLSTIAWENAGHSGATDVIVCDRNRAHARLRLGCHEIIFDDAHHTHERAMGVGSYLLVRDLPDSSPEALPSSTATR